MARNRCINLSFRYPKDDAVLDEKWAGDFLRDTADYPNYTDSNYILNQRDATNYFLDWLTCSDDANYRDMLRHQHRLAAAGKSGSNLYNVYVSKNIILKALDFQHGVIEYSSNLRGAIRKTYPGVFRSELVKQKIPHPRIDALPVSTELFARLRNLHNLTACHTIQLEHIAKPIECVTASPPIFYVTFEGLGVKCRVDYSRNGFFKRLAPSGKCFNALLSECESVLLQIRSCLLSQPTIASDVPLSSYYHMGINAMPFSNINNSLFFAQVNAIRRMFGCSGIQHGKYDTCAMLCSGPAFEELSELNC